MKVVSSSKLNLIIIKNVFSGYCFFFDDKTVLVLPVNPILYIYYSLLVYYKCYLEIVAKLKTRLSVIKKNKIFTASLTF